MQLINAYSRLCREWQSVWSVGLSVRFSVFMFDRLSVCLVVSLRALGRVVMALDLKPGVRGRLKFNPSAKPVNSQVVCLLPVGLLNFVMFSFNYLFCYLIARPRLPSFVLYTDRGRIKVTFLSVSRSVGRSVGPFVSRYFDRSVCPPIDLQFVCLSVFTSIFCILVLHTV